MTLESKCTHIRKGFEGFFNIICIRNDCRSFRGKEDKQKIVNVYYFCYINFHIL